MSDIGTRACADTNMCGTTTDRPALTATLPALDFEFYECDVEPILDRSCAHLGCHGTEEGRALRTYARGRHRITVDDCSIDPSECLHELRSCLSDPSILVPPQNCIGSIECQCWGLPHTPREWRLNFDSARGFALAADGTPLSDMTQSELLRQPEIGAGFPHQGVHFWNPSDPSNPNNADYNAIRMWLEGATRGRPCNSQN